MKKEELSPQEIRQGEASGRMRWVLAVSLVGAVIGLVAIFAVVT